MRHANVQLDIVADVDESVPEGGLTVSRVDCRMFRYYCAPARYTRLEHTPWSQSGAMRSGVIALALVALVASPVAVIMVHQGTRWAAWAPPMPMGHRLPRPAQLMERKPILHLHGGGEGLDAGLGGGRHGASAAESPGASRHEDVGRGELREYVGKKRDLQQDVFLQDIEGGRAIETCTTGCGKDYSAARDCQCSADCVDFGDCCSDYAALCLVRPAGPEAAVRKAVPERGQPTMGRPVPPGEGEGEGEAEERSSKRLATLPPPPLEDLQKAEEFLASAVRKFLPQFAPQAKAPSTTTRTTTRPPSTSSTATRTSTTSMTRTSSTTNTSTSTGPSGPTTYAKLGTMPTLFCFTMVRMSGYEPGLVNAQYWNKAGIFACDEYAIYSNGGVFTVDTVSATEIPAPPVSMGDWRTPGVTTSSWLNTLTFLQVWDIITAGETWYHHDWTVKVDPDAVFFPSRLRDQAAAVTPKLDGPALYFGNCDKPYGNEVHGSLKLYGSIEIFSRNAVGSYKAFGPTCKSDMNWKGWGEDFFMQMCMSKLGVQILDGTNFLSDARCHWYPCSDTTKVAFHDFKDVGKYFDCWGQARANDPLEVIFKL